MRLRRNRIARPFTSKDDFALECLVAENARNPGKTKWKKKLANLFKGHH